LVLSFEKGNRKLVKFHFSVNFSIQPKRQLRTIGMGNKKDEKSWVKEERTISN
jgi:hypothetical protein